MTASGLAATARADRPVEKRSEADYVLNGKVEAVFTDDAGEYFHQVVAVKVEAAERGEGPKPGEIFYASCYRRKPGYPGTNRDSGHTIVPRAGSQVRAFVNRSGGKNEGGFPDWVDVLAEPKPAAVGARQDRDPGRTRLASPGRLP